MKLCEIRDKDGKLPSYVWPGGYPVVYVFDDGETCCPACANGENGSEASESAEPRSGWKLEGYSIHYEGPPEVCAHCGRGIESAYGDPNEDSPRNPTEQT